MSKEVQYGQLIAHWNASGWAPGHGAGALRHGGVLFPAKQGFAV